MINCKVIAIFVKCAKFVTEEKKEEEKDKPQFYSFREGAKNTLRGGCS